ncbi:HAD family hydrolase [Burkholderia alba]|uniref:HAD family hydrolase n=1 Tax=Burkholderia alba TaxID=2683677 RepID=UPI002B0600C5|nr:HAD-IA family hydrolase [Burkholderia alba]
MPPSADSPAYPKAVLFDLLTALLDSWSLWQAAAGSPDAGMRWRAEYLRLTYGCGVYVDYEQLVALAAEQSGLPASAPRALAEGWAGLEPWSGALDALRRLRPHCRLAVVTNCSVRLGREAAARLPIDWDVVVTAEEAGVYKPDPRPYRMALDALGVTAADAAFVAGSSYDLFGTATVGLRTYWHNRAGLAAVSGSVPPEYESATLDALAPWASRFGLAAPSGHHPA